jgi:hypothetical protein
MTIKSVLICATAIAIALTSFELRPAAAASDGAGIAQQTTDFSAARKRRGYRGNPAMPLAAFGAIASTIAGIAAANSQRDYYERHYYGEPAYGYYGAPAHQYYERPVYQQRDYYSRWGGSGGQPGYHGPNVNVPGPTNYGNAAGQNGQQGPGQPGAAPGGSN